LLLLILLGLFGGAHRDTQDRLGDTRRDTRLHLLEVVVRLAFVGDERILLAVSAEVDPLA